MKRGFSASTAVLVALLLGVLFWVGKVVNPPVKGAHDHDHSEETASSDTAANKTPSPEQKKQMEQDKNKNIAMEKQHMEKEMKEHEAQRKKMEKEQMEKMKLAAKSAPGGAKKPFHVAPDGMEPSLWQERDMGPVTPAPDAKK